MPAEGPQEAENAPPEHPEHPEHPEPPEPDDDELDGEVVDVEVLGPDDEVDDEDDDVDVDGFIEGDGADDEDEWTGKAVRAEVIEAVAELDGDDESANMGALREAFLTLPALPDTSASTDPLTVYLARLRQLPVLDADKQQALAIRYQEEGDLEAAKILILTNLRLVVKIAREYRRRWTNLLELIQEGNVGLSEAIKRYDPYREVKFTSYAQYWIRALILNYLMNHFQPVRIGSTRAGRKLFYNLKKARAQLVREGFLNPTPALIAEKLGVKEKDVVEVSQHLDVPPLSLDQTAPGYDETTVGDLLPDAGASSPEDMVGDEQLNSKIREAMDEFAETLEGERDIAIWHERMTADDDRVTLSDLGDRFGVSKERVRQLEVRLKKRFKAFIEQRLGATLDLYFDVD